MSRAYRIKVAEKLSREITASDEICSDLEILEILPPEQMGELLKGKLKERGFEEKDGSMTRQGDGVTVTVDPNTGEVRVKADATENVDLKAEKDDWGYDDVGPSKEIIEKRLQEGLKKDLEKRADAKQAQLQQKATERLEAEMNEVRGELGRVVNEVTREALKIKARSLGEIKEMSEDAEAGTLTIKVEV